MKYERKKRYDLSMCWKTMYMRNKCAVGDCSKRPDQPHKTCSCWSTRRQRIF